MHENFKYNIFFDPSLSDTVADAKHIFSSDEKKLVTDTSFKGNCNQPGTTFLSSFIQNNHESGLQYEHDCKF